MDEATRLLNALIEQLKQNRWLTQTDVENAFRAVPRHLFLPGLPLDEVYDDKAIPTKFRDGVPISSSSQPAIMAIMLEQLQLAPGANVLEIGAGTGYNAALMSQLVGATGKVTTIDIDQDIVAHARENLSSGRVSNVEVVCADGGFGYPSNSPYDAIIATVGVWDICPHWFNQLREGGRIVVPLWMNTTQISIGFEKIDGTLISRSIRPCGFMRLRGAFAGREGYLQVNGLSISLEDPGQADPASLQALLASPARNANFPELQRAENRGLHSYLALRGEPVILLYADDKQRYGFEYAFGLLESQNSLAMIVQVDDCDQSSPFARVYGDDSALLHLKDLVAEWETRGRPHLDHATITATPLDSAESELDSFLIRKSWMEYRINF